MRQHLPDKKYLMACLAITLLLDAHLVYSFIHFGTLQLETGISSVDRWFNFAMARTTRDYGFNFLDPVNRTDVIVYEFFGWWLLGMLSHATGLDPWAMANALLLIEPLAFSLLFYYVVREFSDNRFLPYLSLAIVWLFGSLELLGNSPGVYQREYPDFAYARTWTQLAYGPYMDNLAILCGLVALVFLMRLEKSKWRNGTHIWIFVVSAALCFLLHYLVAIYFLVLFTGIIVAFDWIDANRLQKQRNTWAAVIYSNRM
ncbi:MAG: hypothetical protein P4L33_21030 [Capsulimonadaceae bacterium]|nr:hypothetical protein [Capsulimonadaceae bacterium]